MKQVHLDALAKSLGFDSISNFIIDRYVTKKMSQEAIADELSMTIEAVRKLIKQFDVHKPKLEIPLKYEDAVRHGPDHLAIMLKVSRATAWRWKRIIIARHDEAAHEAAWVTGAPDARAK
jgi:transposase